MITQQTCANSLNTNATIMNEVVNSSLINNLTIGNSINTNLGNHIFNYIQVSSSNSNVSSTITWQNINSNNSNLNIYLTLNQSVNNVAYEGSRNENVIINKLNPPTCQVNLFANGIGAIQASTSLFLNTSFSSNSCTFTSYSTLSNVILMNLSMNIQLNPSQI